MEKVYKVQSESDPDIIYTVKIGDDIVPECNCPDWFNRGYKNFKDCKHIKKVIKIYGKNKIHTV